MATSDSLNINVRLNIICEPPPHVDGRCIIIPSSTYALTFKVHWHRDPVFDEVRRRSPSPTVRPTACTTAARCNNERTVFGAYRARYTSRRRRRAWEKVSRHLNAALESRCPVRSTNDIMRIDTVVIRTVSVRLMYTDIY